MYIVVLIPSNLKFKSLNFCVFNIGNASTIKKNMIYVNNIFKSIKMVKFLKNLLLIKLQNKIYYIIYLYSFILETNTKTNWLKNFLNKNM